MDNNDNVQQKNLRHHYRNWLLKAPLGLTIIGFGACLVAEAAMQKYDGVDTWQWIAYGTLALIVLNSGVSVVGSAVVHRSNYERLREK